MLIKPIFTHVCSRLVYIQTFFISRLQLRKYYIETVQNSSVPSYLSKRCVKEKFFSY